MTVRVFWAMKTISSTSTTPSATTDTHARAVHEERSGSLRRGGWLPSGGVEPGAPGSGPGAPASLCGISVMVM